MSIRDVQVSPSERAGLALAEDLEPGEGQNLVAESLDDLERK